jgi:hypothetical protein
MNGHLERMLDAYLDGELENGGKRRAEAHLKECAACRAELGRRRALSEMLQAAAAPAEGKSEQRFTAEVGLRKAARPGVRRSAWWVMAPPVALFLAWAFVQSALILDSALQWIPGAEDALRDGLAAMSGSDLLPQIARGWTVPAFPVPGAWDSIFLTAILLGIGVLFTGWFAGWIFGQRAAGSQE